ncbi:MAG: PQQ-like beta-propeller repeat protein, partial [Planctomycetales bacterium]
MKPFLYLLLAVSTLGRFVIAEDWPQAAGPNGNFIAEGKAPEKFSVSRNENVLWRTRLPSTGQGAAIVSGGRVFVTSHEPITEDSEMGSMMFGLCFDAKTGKELWRREIPGTRVTDFSSLFSDNTAASPVANGEFVCFSNVGGTTACFDFKGKEQWSWTWTPFGRHHARQHEPILHGDQVILMHVPRNDLPAKATTKGGAKPLGTGRDLWTRLQSYDIRTGKRSWIAASATSVHSTSLIGRSAAGSPAILTGRGGGHQPPEKPYGLSLVSAVDGSRIWDLEIKGYGAAQNAAWNKDVACLFAGKEHQTVDVKEGKPLDSVSLVEDVTVCRFENGIYSTKTGQAMKFRKAITNQSNCLVGDYHYFRAHDGFFLGRVNIRQGTVEYLQVPAQVVREPGKPDETRWRDATRN